MKRLGIFSIVGLVLIVVFAWFAWMWVFCRFYVPPSRMAIVTSKEGSNLEPGQILAKKGQKGVLEEPLGPGRHFLNPYAYSWKIVPMQIIPPGKVGIVTSKVGKDLPAGEFLADPDAQEKQKGIWRWPLGPGTYRLNPMGYNVEIIDAISIPIGYVGVVTSLSGASTEPHAFAKTGQKGVMEDILQPGLYYINPKAYKVDVIEVGVNQVSLSGKSGGAVLTKTAIAAGNQAMESLQMRVLESQQEKRSRYMDEHHDSIASAPAPPQAQQQRAAQTQDPGAENPTFVLTQHVGFPSRDGFDILLDMTVEFELLPEKVAGIYRDYGDMPAVVDKVLMPQILSVSRLKGSAYRAIDFIIGDAREKFQNDLTHSLQEVLALKNISIHDALIRHVNVPEPILAPLQQASIAGEQDLTNKERQKTAIKQAELNTQTQLIEQKSAEVTQETAKMKAEIGAEKNKLVAEIEAEMTRQVAALERQTAEVLAARDVTLGKAKADALQMTEGEKAKGFSLKIKALGDPMAYNLSEFAKSLNTGMQINIVHSGPGTLWTDLENLSPAAGALLKSADSKANEAGNQDNRTKTTRNP